MGSLPGMKKTECCGCEVCVNICKNNAIKMKMDKEGFYYPEIFKDRCVSCGLCQSVCPEMSPAKTTNIENPSVYAGWSINEEIRLNSTSGGIFSELARLILSKGGYVCGAVYNEEQMVEHFVARREEDLKRIRQSKYVQSRMNNIYRELGSILKNGESLLFCGSTCQCAALKNYLDKEKISREKLVLADFICRGANSPKVYRKFLDELEQEYDSKIRTVWFKNKTYGWNRFSTKIEFENGESYLEDRFNDVYIRGYIEKDLYMRPSCTECRYKGFPRVSDVTLADFWGVQLKDRQEESDKGTSMIVINSDKGSKLFELLKQYIFFEQKTLFEAESGNFCMYNSVPFGLGREQFMKDLDTMPVIENIRRFL